jgi:hypothetical protein
MKKMVKMCQFYSDSSRFFFLQPTVLLVGFCSVVYFFILVFSVSSSFPFWFTPTNRFLHLFQGNTDFWIWKITNVLILYCLYVCMYFYCYQS